MKNILFRIAVDSLYEQSKNIDFRIDFIVNDYELDSYPRFCNYIYKSGKQLYLLRIKESDISKIYNTKEVKKFTDKNIREYNFNLVKTAKIKNGKIMKGPKSFGIICRSYIFKFSYYENVLHSKIEIR